MGITSMLWNKMIVNKATLFIGAVVQPNGCCGAPVDLLWAFSRSPEAYDGGVGVGATWNLLFLNLQ